MIERKLVYRENLCLIFCHRTPELKYYLYVQYYSVSIGAYYSTHRVAARVNVSIYQLLPSCVFFKEHVSEAVGLAGEKANKEEDNREQRER